MNLKQLRYICEVYRQGNHISAAAEALHTSQPGISKQIQMIEEELGFEIFMRRRNRIVGLTEPGQEAVAIAQRVLTEIDNLKNLGEDFNAIGSGRWKVMDAFKKAKIEPNIIFGAVDADVSKTYVEMGLGIAILTSITYDKYHDRGLRARDASHLFEPSTTYVRVRANTYLRKFLLDFIRMLVPHLSEDDIRSALNKERVKATT